MNLSHNHNSSGEDGIPQRFLPQGSDTRGPGKRPISLARLHALTSVVKLAIVLAIPASCAKAVHLQPPESFEQKLQRTEGVSCADLTYHEDELIPAPDCQAIVAAWTAGRADMARIYPAAASIPMSRVSFIRPALAWYDGKPYPLIVNQVDHPAAYSMASPIVSIFYAYVEAIAHEAHHVLGAILIGSQARTAEAIAQDDGGVQPSDWQGLGYFPLWYIFCHGTPDDPFGRPGDRRSCSQPYSGPRNPNMSPDAPDAQIH
jgi:hypothetical protein